MKKITLIALLTLAVGFGCFAQDDEVVDFFTLTEMYCVNEEHSIENNIARLFPNKKVIMWASNDTLNIISAFIPDSVDSKNDKLFALAKVKYIDCNLTKDEIIYEDDSPKLCAQGKITSVFFKGSNAQYLIVEKLKGRNPKDPYQYVCFTLYYKPVNGMWYLLQMYGKTLELKHKF